MVSMSRAAPEASRMCKVAAMISGPMPSPCATVMGVLLDIGKSKHIGLRRVTQPLDAGSLLRASAGVHENPRCHDLGLAKAFRLSSGSSQILTAAVGVTTIHRRHRSGRKPSSSVSVQPNFRANTSATSSMIGCEMQSSSVSWASIASKTACGTPPKTKAEM